jgi:hypothetical protein
MGRHFWSGLLRFPVAAVSRPASSGRKSWKIRNRSYASDSLLLIVSIMLAGLVLAWGQSPQAQTPAARIDVATIVLIEPAVETAFPILITSTVEAPKQAFVRIRGLPPAATLSDGHAIKSGSWAVPLATLPSLKIEVPPGSEGKFQVLIALLLVTGEIISEVEMTLVVVPTAPIMPAAKAQTPTGPASAALATEPQPNSSPLAARPLRLAPDRGSPPPAAAEPALRAEDRDRAVKYVQRGDEGLSAGNITIARLFYQRAAEIGWAPGALALAGTYDPSQLSQQKVLGGVTADRVLAQKWYEKARELGSPQAAQRLRQLGSQ